VHAALDPVTEGSRHGVPRYHVDGRVQPCAWDCAALCEPLMPNAVQVTVLGSGDAFGAGGRLHSAYLVESAGATFLVDCGATVLQGLKRAGVDPARVDFVCLSHLHGDHFGGVPFLFLDFLYESRRDRPITIYGPEGTQARVNALFAALYQRQATQTPPYPVTFAELEPGPTTTTAQGVSIEAFAVPHVAELVCFGFRIRVGGRTIVYSGDTGWTDAFVERTRGADLFICECSTFETRLDIHIAYPDIAARASTLGCRRLILSHLGAEPLRRRGEINLEVAEDGMVIGL
jgi:ribonuclease BN (tRNA processing enzyme)